jgi:hypothetical protein
MVTACPEENGALVRVQHPPVQGGLYTRAPGAGKPSSVADMSTHGSSVGSP